MDEPTFPDTAEGARDCLRYIADLDLNDKVRDEVEAGKLEWVMDPSVPGVWAVCHKGTMDSVVIVYLKDNDHECDTDWLYS